MSDSELVPPKKRRYRKRLTEKQEILVKAKTAHPNASLSDLAIMSNYAGPQAVYAALKCPAVKKAIEQVRDLMLEREKLKYDALLTKLEEGLDATQVHRVAVDDAGKVKASVETPDHAIRHKFLESALKLHGVLGSQEEGAAASGPLNIAIIMAGGGTDAEKDALAEAMLAARIARGLHPHENRLMTPEEAQAVREGRLNAY